MRPQRSTSSASQAPVRLSRSCGVVAALARLGTAVGMPSVKGGLAFLDTVLPAARVGDLRRNLPGLTRGEGVLEASFEGYEPVVGVPPTRRRRSPSPLEPGE